MPIYHLLSAVNKGDIDRFWLSKIIRGIAFRQL